MRRYPVFLLCLLWISGAGCEEPVPKMNREQAHRQWDEVRARLQYRLALESFKAGQLKQSQERLREALLLHPTLIEAHVLSAQILLEKGETAAAEQALARACECGGDSPEIDYLRGVIAQRYEKFREALGYYQKASRRDPMKVHYVVAVAEMLVSLGRPEEAVQLARSRWTDFEQSPALRALVGDIETMLGRHDEAAEAFREACRLSPDDEVLRGQLGTALVNAGRYEEALEILIQATNAPGDVPAATWLALGRCQYHLERNDEAKKALRKAVARDPKNAMAWSWLAQSCLVAGDLAGARRAAAEAARLSPDRSEFVLLQAYVCWQQGDVDTAQGLVQNVLSRNPEDALARDLLDRITGENNQAEAPSRPLVSRMSSPVPPRGESLSVSHEVPSR